MADPRALSSVRPSGASAGVRLPLSWYRKRSFFKLDAAIFLAQKVEAEPELLPPRRIKVRKEPGAKESAATPQTPRAAKPRATRRQAPAPKPTEAASRPAQDESPAPAPDGHADP